MSKSINRLTCAICGLAMLWLLLWTSGAWGAPFLVSDPYGPCGNPGETMCPVAATIYIEDATGASVINNVPLQSDLSLRYDLMSRPVAETTYKVDYVDALGDHSELSDPYLLLVIPASPKGLRGTGTPSQ